MPSCTAVATGGRNEPELTGCPVHPRAPASTPQPLPSLPRYWPRLTPVAPSSPGRAMDAARVVPRCPTVGSSDPRNHGVIPNARLRRGPSPPTPAPMSRRHPLRHRHPPELPDPGAVTVLPHLRRPRPSLPTPARSSVAVEYGDLADIVG